MKNMLAMALVGLVASAALVACDGTGSDRTPSDDASSLPDLVTVPDGAPSCDDPAVYDILRELWIDENGVGHAAQVTRISDAFEFRYDRVGGKRYCNVSIFINGYQVEVRQPDGSTESRVHNESRIGYIITNHPEDDEFTVRVMPGWLPHVDRSISESPTVQDAMAQRPEVCERMLREYAANPNNAPYLWVLEDPDIDCERAGGH